MLTDAACKRATPRARQYTLTDGDGLELLVTPAGTKVWRFRYRLGDERKRLPLGRYPTMGVAAARAAAAKARMLLWRGEDPAGARVQEASESLDALLDRYAAEHAGSWKPGTAKRYALAIARFREWARTAKVLTSAHITPSSLASFRAWSIARPRRTKLKGGSVHDSVATDQPRTVAAINAELRAVKTMLQRLRKAGRLPAITSKDAITDNLGLLPLDIDQADPLRPGQLRDLVAACQAHDAAIAHAPRGLLADRIPIAPFVLTCLLSGMRVGEVLRLTWQDVDLADLVIRVLPFKTKRMRLVDLRVSPALVRLLASLPHSGPRVFAHTEKTALRARGRLVTEYGAPPFLYASRHSRVDSRSVPTLRSTCGCYLTNSPAIFGAASVYRSAAQLGHSVDVAQKHYLGVLRSIPADATTLEAAMGIAGMLAEVDRPGLRVVR